MSKDEELEKLRQKKLEEMQRQAAQQQDYENQMASQQNQQQAQYDAQKQALLQRILSSEARARLTNIKMARPEFAEQIEMSLIQAVQQGGLRGKLPLSDEQFKNILIQLQGQNKKRDSKIRIL
jgi:programmed cell death protein 5